MRKAVLPSRSAEESSPGEWLDLDSVARAEISSEDPRYPFENVLAGDTGDGWRAGQPGLQVIRLRFDRPQAVRRLRLVFREEAEERAQEFAVFATTRTGARREVRRQQWTFSPGGSTVETEDVEVNLPDVSVLEVEIDPGRHDHQKPASLQFLGIA